MLGGEGQPCKGCQPAGSSYRRRERNRALLFSAREVDDSDRSPFASLGEPSHAIESTDGARGFDSRSAEQRRARGVQRGRHRAAAAAERGRRTESRCDRAGERCLGAGFVGHGCAVGRLFFRRLQRGRGRRSPPAHPGPRRVVGRPDLRGDRTGRRRRRGPGADVRHVHRAARQREMARAAPRERGGRAVPLRRVEVFRGVARAVRRAGRLRRNPATRGRRRALSPSPSTMRVCRRPTSPTSPRSPRGRA